MKKKENVTKRKKKILHQTKRLREKRKYSPTIPVLKKLKKGFSLYGAKNENGDKILEYTKKQEKTNNDSCLLSNISWFGVYEVAKRYKTKENNIYKWDIFVPTNLIVIDENNEGFFEKMFEETTISLIPTILLEDDLLKKINVFHPYLQMSNNERAYFEFKFAFGYLTLKEQYEFLVFLKYLIANDLIQMNTRENKSILTKLNTKILYYDTNVFFEKKPKFNRLSFYYFDKYAISNLCKVLPRKYNISGIYQPNNTSFWFPDFIVYKMNIEEYILFNPHHNLVYDKKIE